jgi:DNA-directed RNA polymerase specialized sigma24 family protein
MGLLCGEIPSEAMAAAHARILRICSCAGLAPVDAQDTAQEIWLWLLRSGRLSEAGSLPWIGAVAVNFVRRYWRQRKRRNSRESQAAATRALGGDGGNDFELGISFNEMERALPADEAELLHLVRRGATFAEAARVLGIPRGSQDYHRKLLYTHLSVGLFRAASHGSASNLPAKVPRNDVYRRAAARPRAS